MGMPYVCLYTSYLTSLAPYTDSQLGRLVRAMLAYGAAGEEPAFRGCERLIWPMLKDQLDRDKERYRQRCEQNRANGAKGGRPKNPSVIPETEGFSEKPKKPKEKENEKEKEKEKEKENKKEKENEKENEIENENEKEPGAEKKKENEKEKENGTDGFFPGKPGACVLSLPTMRTVQKPLPGTELSALPGTEFSTQDCENPPFVVY